MGETKTDIERRDTGSHLIDSAVALANRLGLPEVAVDAQKIWKLTAAKGNPLSRLGNVPLASFVALQSGLVGELPKGVGEDILRELWPNPVGLGTIIGAVIGGYIGSNLSIEFTDDQGGAKKFTLGMLVGAIIGSAVVNHTLENG